MSISRRAVSGCLSSHSRLSSRPAAAFGGLRRHFATESAATKDSAASDPQTSPSSGPHDDRIGRTHTHGDARPSAGVQSASVQLAEARRLAHEQVLRLANSLHSTARKQASTIAASIQTLELERRLKEVGGKINQATGYEEIERLRSDVGEKEKALLVARENASKYKQAYTERVRLRADSQREVNDLLQRKATWTGPDVIRFTELVQTEHENDKAEKEAKEAMDAAEAEVEKGFSGMMQAILERYHEEQVWSDKIRSMSTYGSLAITSLNVLLFIISLLLIEPWRRRRLVENVEERLRTNAESGHEATRTQLETLQGLLQHAQATLDAIAEAGIQAANSAPGPVAQDFTPSTAELTETDRALSDTLLPPETDSSTETGTTAVREPAFGVGWALDEVKTAVEGHEVLAAGAAGAVGGLALAALVALAGR